MDSVTKDKRFAHVGRDPRFRRIPKSQRKVKIDKRFSGMFSDKRFKLKYTVDKRGRPTNTTTDENLKRFYDIDSDEEDDEKGEQEELDESGREEEKQKTQKTLKAKSKKAPKKVSFKVTDLKEEEEEVDDEEEEEENDEGEEEEDELDESETEVGDDIREKLQDLSVDYARGEGVLLSESSSEEEEDEEEENEADDEIIHDWGELDRDAERTDEATRRLAVCNMDWDRIRAVDLMVLLQSFAPQGGTIKSVDIYPSEFGMQRMKEEELHGPKELVDETVGSEDEEGNIKNGEDYHREKLRKYQLMRLKYYYAVVECDSMETAAAIYDECDGQEFESSSARLDLRFIPDDMTFDQKPHDRCDNLPDLSQYEPRNFLTSALQQAHVHLTWDETDPDRQNAMQKLFQPKKGGGKATSAVEKFDDEKLKAFLATSSSEDEESETEDDKGPAQNVSDEVSVSGESSRIAKYRSLLAEIEASEQQKKTKNTDKGMEMEVTWDFGLKEKADKLVQQKIAEKEKKTPWEEQQEKRKQKRKLMKEEKKKQNKTPEVASEPEEESEAEEDIPSDVDLNDPYFKEEFENSEFKKPGKAKKNPKNQKESQQDSSEDSSENKDGELELLLMDEDQDKRKHFSLKDIVEKSDNKKKKRKNKKNDKNGETEKTDDFQVKVDDPRFSALFTSHHYNVDPSDPNFKKTAGMDAILKEKQKRRGTEFRSEEPAPKSRKESDSEISRLVRSVKMKTALRK